MTSLRPSTQVTVVTLLFLGLIGFICFLVILPNQTFIVSSPIASVLPPHVHIEGDSVSDKGHGVTLLTRATTTEDMWVTKIEVTPHNIPLSVLHHVVLFTLGGEDPECPGIPLEKDYAAFSQDAPTLVRFPKPYGMFIPKGTPLILSTALHNPETSEGTGTTYHNASVSLALTYVRNNSDRNKNVELVRATLLDKPYCNLVSDGPSFVVPSHTEHFVKAPHKNEKDRGRLVFTKSGTILSAFGHMHGWDGGKEVSLFLNDSLVETWKTHKLATTSAEGRVWETPLTTLSLQVQKGGVAHVEAVYDNPGEEPVRDAMGTVRLFFAPD